VTDKIDSLAVLRAELQALHDRYNSWRKVQNLHFPTVPAGTLCAIAKGGPVPRKHRKALGLVGRRERTEVEKRITKMARETRKAVLWTNQKKPLPKNG
jgi:hypothetical protein